MAAPYNFARYLLIAQRFLSAARLPGLLRSVARKRNNTAASWGTLRADLALLQQLCLAWWRGEYRDISRQALLAVVAALVYFVTPLDALPDWIPLAGLLDDLAVLAWVLRTWRDELQQFQLWRAAQTPEAQRMLESLALDEDRQNIAPADR